MSQHQGWSLHPVHHVGHCEGLAAAGDPKQDLMAVAPLETGRQLVDGPGLITPGLVFGLQIEFGHICKCSPGGREKGSEAGEL